MVQIPILSGIYTKGEDVDVRIAYPVNMVPVPANSGVSPGYLRPADGIVGQGDGPGVGRGGIEWRGVLYRVMGSKFCSVSADGVVTEIGDVGEGDIVRMSYGFDLLAIASNQNLFYYDGLVLTQVTDPNVGVVLDVQWIDGYYAVTDGQYVAFSDIRDPFKWSALTELKYVSSESDPDPIVGVRRLRNELYAINRNSIECLDNIGGDKCPFARISGAKITKGAIGTHAVCIYMETLAFVGSGYNEAPGVYLGVNAAANKISTVEVDRILASYSEADLSQALVEARNDNGHQHLYIHLVDRTLVYDSAASQALGTQVWFILTSSMTSEGIYRARHLVWCYDRWNSCDPTSYAVGRLTQDVSTHYGERVRWEFSTPITYNDGNGGAVYELELVTLSGRVALGIEPTISTSYSYDGVDWSVSKFVRVGKIGNRLKRIVWFKQGSFTHMRIQRFQGNSDAHIAVMRLEANMSGSAF